jgi:hypothetical protein
LCTKFRTFPTFSLALFVSEKDSMGSSSASEWEAFDDSAPPCSTLSRRVAWPSFVMRDLVRSPAPRLRESSESSPTVESREASSASSAVRSIGFLGSDVDWVFSRLGAGEEKTVRLLLGFPKEPLSGWPLMLLLIRFLAHGP